MATSPEAYYKLIKDMQNSDADAAFASRWIKDSLIKTRQPALRRFMSRGYNFLIRLLFFSDIRDTQCGAKILNKKALKEIIKELGLSNWGFDVELLYAL